jgi:hypothetical protein
MASGLGHFLTVNANFTRKDEGEGTLAALSKASVNQKNIQALFSGFHVGKFRQAGSKKAKKLSRLFPRRANLEE